MANQKVIDISTVIKKQANHLRTSQQIAVNKNWAEKVLPSANGIYQSLSTATTRKADTICHHSSLYLLPCRMGKWLKGIE